MLEDIKYHRLVIDIPQKSSQLSIFSEEDDDIPEYIELDRLIISPSRSISGLHHLIDYIYNLKDEYYKENEQDPSYLILNERDYRDLIWYFSNQNGRIDIFDSVLGLEVLLMNVHSPKVKGLASEELMNKHRKD